MLEKIKKSKCPIKSFLKDFFKDFLAFMCLFCIAEVIIACFKSGLFLTLLLLAKWFVGYLVISLVFFIITKIKNKFSK